MGSLLRVAVVSLAVLAFVRVTVEHAMAATPREARERAAALVLRAGTLERQRNLPEAARLYREAVELYPTLPAVWLWLARYQWKEPNTRKVLAIVRRAARYNPDSLEVDVFLGDLLGRDPSLPGSLQELRQRVTALPGSSDRHRNLGTNLAFSGRQSEGITELREAIRLNPGSAAAHFELAECLQGMGDPNGSLAELREAVKADPEDAPSQQWLAMELWKVARFDDALQVAKRWASLSPNRREAIELLCEAYSRAGMTTSCIDTWEAAIERWPKVARYRKGLAQSLLKRGDLAFALDEYRQYLHLKPSTGRPGSDIVRFLSAAKDRRGARAAIVDALDQEQEEGNRQELEDALAELDAGR